MLTFVKVHLLLTIIFGIILISLVSIYSIYSPLSPFYNDSDHVTINNDNIKRRLQAQKALKDIRLYCRKNASNVNLPLFSNPKSNELCIGIMTIPRQNDNLQYLVQTVASLITRSNWTNHAQLFAFNLSSDSHEELESLKDLISIKTPTLIDEPIRRLLKDHHHLYNQNTFKFLKQCIDYLTVLKSLVNMKECKRILILEDDVLAATDWYKKIIYFDKKREELVSDKWIYLKLFSTFKFKGWTSESFYIFQLVILSLTLAVAINFILKMSLKRFTLPITFSNEMSTFSLAFLIFHILKWLLLLVICFSAFMIIGRQSLFNRFPKNSIQILDIGAMAQAVLWNRKIVPHYIKFLQDKIEQDNIEIEPIDLLFKEFEMEFNRNIAKRDRHEVLISVPDVFQHIGVSSTFNRREKSNLIRSYNFPDDNQPIKFTED